MNDKARIPEYLIVGQVVAPFGVQGELKVNILTEFPDRFNRLGEVTLAPFSYIEPEMVPPGSLNPATARLSNPKPPHSIQTPVGPTPFSIEAINIHKGQLRLRLHGVESADDAVALRGCWVLVPTESARQLPPGSYYVYQLVGLDVLTTSGEHIGQVADVLTSTANDVYVVKGSGVQDPSGELLVPAVKAVVKSVEPEKGQITILPIEEWT